MTFIRAVASKDLFPRRTNPKSELSPVKNPGSIQLFNINSGSGENVNLQVEHVEKVEELKLLLADYIKNGRSTLKVTSKAMSHPQ